MLDLDDLRNYEFLRPLIAGWLSKIEAALTSPGRKRWLDVGSECQMFYNKSAAAMWDPMYAKKFWRGVKSPRFRVNINKAFEFTAIYLPNLMWDVPHRTVSPKDSLELPPDLISHPNVRQALAQQIQQKSTVDRLTAHLMQGWLNYTPREMPGGGLEWHSEMALLDALLKGSGHLWPAPYSMPGSDKMLTGCFHKAPEDLVFDPDFKTSQECKWIALRHIQPHWQVEKKFRLPAGSLKGKATLESGWHHAEANTKDGFAAERASGKTNDLVVWYEVWSKMGVGARLTGMTSLLKNHLEEVVGDYAYLAVCPDCPYPLNCPADKIRRGATDEEIRLHFEWPVPLWADDRWPVERLIFWEDPESPYGVPPLSPALGELKAINCIVSWLVNRTWHASRQMWAVLGQYHDDMKKVLDDGDDCSVFPLPPGAEDVKKVLQLIEQKEVNRDAWAVLELLSNAFDKRMGMTPFVYGQNEDGTQDRTASTTEARKSAVSARPEYMQKKVVAWQSRVAGVEAMLSWMFVKGRDVEQLLGPVGAGLWQQYIENADQETVVRQMSYEVAASSMRRPNKERDIANLQEVMGRYLPLLQAYGELSGNYTPVNGTMQIWGELHDMDLGALAIPEKDPNDPNAQLDQQLKQAEVQKTQAEALKLQGEAQANPLTEIQMEAQFKQQEIRLEQKAEEARVAMEIEKLKAELQAKMAELQMKLQEKQMEMQIKATEHAQEMQFQRESSQTDLAVKEALGAQQIEQGRQQITQQKQQGNLQLKQGQQKLQQRKQSNIAQVQATKDQSQAKVAATKSLAAAKPNSSGSK